MNYFTSFILFLTQAAYTSAIAPEIHYILGCFETGDIQVTVEFDDDEVYYADFNKKEAVWTVPNFDHIKFDKLAYDYSLLSIYWCRSNMNLAKHWYPPNIPKAKEPPVNTIYPKDDIDLGLENTLICFVNHFYPPSIKVKWTKNNNELKEGVSLTRYHPNKDGSFHQVSTLSFIPEEGDIYACTVEHPALESPQTRIWEVESNESSAGPAIFCGVGLTLGLLGVAAGTFLFVKQPLGNQCA